MKKQTQHQISAAALRYRQSQAAAPKVTAKGQGHIARKIMELAGENDIPVIENKALLDFLMDVEIDEPIPPAAFEAAAGIYSFLLELDDKYAQILD